MLVCSLLATAAIGAARGQKGDKFISVYSSPRRERSEEKPLKIKKVYMRTLESGFFKIVFNTH